MAAKKKKGSRSGLVFLVTFLLFLAVFGGVMIWGVGEYWRQTRPAENVSPSAGEQTPAAPRDRTHRVLVITEEGGEARGFTVLSAEGAAGRVRVIPVPRETAVTDGVTQTRLFEYYKTADIAAVTDRVGEMLGLSLSHYAVITYPNLRRLIGHFGEGVIYTLGEPVSYVAEGGAPVSMKAGVRTLTAAQATDLLKYTGWHSGRRGTAAVQADILAALINQYLVPGRFDENDRDFAAVIGFCQSDVLTSQFASARGDLLALAKINQMDLATVVFPHGEYVGVGDEMRFEMEDKPL